MPEAKILARIAGRALVATTLLVSLAVRPAAAQEQEHPGPDPVAEFTAAQAKRLKRHKYFNRVTYTTVDTHAPLRFLVQRPDKDYVGYEEAEAARLVDWLTKIHSMFLERYAQPNGIEPNGALPLYTIALLASKGDYRNYADATRSQDLYSTRAHYNHELRIAVTFENSFNRGAPHIERQPTLHEFVHELQHAYHIDPAGPPAVAWFNEGLAEYLSFHLASDPEALARHELDRGAAEDVVAAASEATVKRVYLHPLEELIGLRDYNAVYHAVGKRARAARVGYDRDVALQLFYKQSYLLMHFLHHGKDGAYLENVRSFVGNVLAGDPGGRAFREAFPDVSLEQLDAEFLAYAHGVLDVALPGHLSAHAAEASEELAPGEAAPLELGALALDADDGDALVGLAVGLALEGNTARAAEILRDSLGRAGEGPERARLELELARVEAWNGLRDAYLAELAATGVDLHLRDWQGSRLKAGVAGVEAGRVQLLDDGAEPASIELSEIKPVDLADTMGKRAESLAPGWVRLYPYCASGHPKWKNLRRRDSSQEVADLKRDAESFYPGALATGRVALVLELLRSAGAPEDAAAAKVCLERVRSIWPAEAERPLVASRRDALEALARRALAFRFEDLGLESLVHGDLQRAGEGRVRLRYDFRDRAQAQDFLEDSECLADHRDEVAPLAFPERATFAVGRGSISGHGATALRHVLEFEAPLEVSYDVTWEARSGQPVSALRFLLGLCADGYGNAIMVEGLGHLTAYDKRAGYVQQAFVDASTIMVGDSYTFVVKHDGETVSVSVDGRPVSRAKAGPLTRGGLFLWLQSDLDVTVRDLVIEGSVPASSLAAARQALVEAELVALGF